MEHCWKVSDGENSKLIIGKDNSFPVHAMKTFKGREATARTHY
jgi:hypothetical protein